MNGKIKKAVLVASFLSLGLVSGTSIAGTSCNLNMTNSDGFGAATIKVDGDELKVKLQNTIPNTLYTVWVTFNGSPDKPAGAAGSAPAFAVDAPVYNGMRPDLNAVFTDDTGDGMLKAELGYDIMVTGAAPVTTGINTQGDNRVGRDWMRVFENGSTSPASVQVVDANGTPLVQRATATGLAIVSHPDNTTHGGTPGVSGVDQNGAFKGALADCM